MAPVICAPEVEGGETIWLTPLLTRCGEKELPLHHVGGERGQPRGARRPPGKEPGVTE